VTIIFQKDYNRNQNKLQPNFRMKTVCALLHFVVKKSAQKHQITFGGYYLGGATNVFFENDETTRMIQ